MKIVAYEDGEVTMIGRVDADGSVRAIAPRDQFWRDPQAALAAPLGDSVGPLSSLEERPTPPSTAKVICVGLNYRKHAIESNLPIPEVPVIFARWASTLSVDGASTPAVDEKFDWEVELGAVVGRSMFRVSAQEAADGVFGYVAFNDLSARTFQMQSPTWTLGKNTPASGPMSPIVTADEVGDPADGLRLTTRVNGTLVQDSTTSDMIFTIPQIIAHVTQVLALTPGDLIITGTPPGVGMASGNFLKPGDTVEVEVEKIGKVRTPIVAPSV